MKNKFDSFIPLMNEWEYKFIEKFLTKEDILLEWGSGNSTLYFSGLVKKLISIEHDEDYYNAIKVTIDINKPDNIELYHVEPTIRNQNIKRYDQLKDYIEFPVKENFKFTKILIDGRARKECAQFIYDHIDENVIIFIHDFNHSDVEGYEDATYFEDILSLYTIVEFERAGRGIVALKKKEKFEQIIFENRNQMISSFGKKLRVCELGTFRGDFLDFIYENTDPEELVSIDIFDGINHSGDKDGLNVIYSNLTEDYNNLLAKYGGTNVKIIKGESQKVLLEFPDEYFDLIYIDADHSFESVYSDLNLSYRKIKKGGIISGHDYEKEKFFEVYLAVNKFCVEKELLIDYRSKDKLPSYGIIKL